MLIYLHFPSFYHTEYNMTVFCIIYSSFFFNLENCIFNICFLSNDLKTKTNPINLIITHNTNIFTFLCLKKNKKTKNTLTWFLSLGLNVVVQSKNEQNDSKFPHSEPHSHVNVGEDERLQIIISEGRMLLLFVLSRDKNNKL